MSKGPVHKWFVTFLLSCFTAEFGPLRASHLTPRPPAPLQGVPLSVLVKVSDFNVFFFTPPQQQTLQITGLLKKGRAAG